MPADPRRAYWRANLRLVALLLSIWFLASFGAGILGHRWLDAWTLPGTRFPLGFWFAQQGAIYVFVALIATYVVAMNRLDRRFGFREEDEPAEGGSSATDAAGGDGEPGA